MKNEVNNKIKIIITILLAVLVAVSSIMLKIKKDNKNSHNEKISDAIKFKKEYESLNGKKAYENYTYQKLSILENNPFKYTTMKEAVNIIKSGTGIVYFGFKNCPWCRNAVNVMQYLNVDKIYYVDLTDKRDEYSFLNGKLIKTKDADESYYELLKLLDGTLDEYKIEDDNKNKVSAGEKRIYVPLVVGILNGKIVGYHADTVTLKDGQSPYDILDNNQMEELKKVYDEIKNKVYDDDTCGLKPTEGC